MVVELPKLTAEFTVADLLRDLGDISPQRIRMNPSPGTATIADVERNKLCELIDGTLVEKAMGMRESLLAVFLIELISSFVRKNNLGLVTAPDGTFRLMTDLVRLPDVAFISWDRFPDGKIPEENVPRLAPDLAIEVLSEGNTKAEMIRKRREFFEAGVRIIWMIDRRKKTVEVYASESEFTTLSENDTLDGGTLLPGFRLPIRELFASLDRTAP